ncbi:uncharacterized protein [Physcomitrium patens]|uniref:uncharacterized protein isoform X1 n=1 Tax=Physcomitrium patens TaxID=3218 RepID=UPI003CCE0588
MNIKLPTRLWLWSCLLCLRSILCQKPSISSGGGHRVYDLNNVKHLRDLCICLNCKGIIVTSAGNMCVKTGTLRWRLLWPKIEREQCFYGHGSGSIKNSSIHLFCHSILVWSMRCSQMSFDPNLLVEFQKFFGHELTTLIFAKDFNLMLALAFYVGMKSLELSES